MMMGRKKPRIQKDEIQISILIYNINKVMKWRKSNFRFVRQLLPSVYVLKSKSIPFALPYKPWFLPCYVVGDGGCRAHHIRSLASC